MGSALFAIFSYVSQPLAANEGPTPFLLPNLVISLAGAAAIGAVAEGIQGRRPWSTWLAGVLCPLVGTMISLAAFAVPIHGIVMLSPDVVLLTFIPYVPTAVLGSVVASYAFKNAGFLRYRQGA